MKKIMILAVAMFAMATTTFAADEATNATAAYNMNVKMGSLANALSLNIDEAFFQGKKIILFDDIIASGNSVAKFADQLEGYGAKVELALALGKKISDGYDQK